jgi:hypothetical protein
MLAGVRRLLLDFPAGDYRGVLTADHRIDVFRQFAVHWDPGNVPPSGPQDVELLNLSDGEVASIVRADQAPRAGRCATGDEVVPNDRGITGIIESTLHRLTGARKAHVFRRLDRIPVGDPTNVAPEPAPSTSQAHALLGFLLYLPVVEPHLPR